MDLLWAIWRSKYIQSFKDEKTDPNNNPCFLCEAINAKGREKEVLVFERREKAVALLNKYPYNGGHSLIAPVRHIGDFTALSDEESFELIKLTQDVIKAIRTYSSPHGFNVGINLGRTAGAGLPGHLHVHVVPRWDGDTSFISTISETKVISQSLEETYDAMVEAFRKIGTK